MLLKSNSSKWEQCYDIFNCITIKPGEFKNNRILIDLSNEINLKHKILNSLMPIMEIWSGQKLSQNLIIYGIRGHSQTTLTGILGLLIPSVPFSLTSFLLYKLTMYH